MDELVLFYYLSWLLCILIYFFMQISSIRTSLFLYTLLFINISPFFITVSSTQVSLSFIILVFGTIILFGFTIFRTYEWIVAFICMISYVALLLWDKISPVLFFMPSKLIISSLLVLILCLLLKPFTHKIAIAFVGLTLGQFVYESILIGYGLHGTIGDYRYINYILVTILLIVLVESVQKMYMLAVRFIKV